MDPHQVDSHVIGNYNIHSACIVALGCGFAVHRNLRDLVSRFIAVDERLAAIRIKTKCFYISLICAHDPTEDKDDTAKDVFYDNRCRRSDIKILIGDFNAKVGGEGIFFPNSRETQSTREKKRQWLQTCILHRRTKHGYV